MQFGDGREVALLQFVYSHPELEKIRGNPKGVLNAIDEFARTNTGLINVGERKGAIVCDLITQYRPSCMLELGGYIGYSGILFGDALRRAGGKRYLSIENDPLFAAVASSLVDLAGLSDIVKYTVGTGFEGIQRLHEQGELARRVDMAFFDHHKPSYTPDLKLCERLGIVGLGTVLVADNMIVPGNPAYLAYVRASVAEKREKAKAGEESGNPNLGYATWAVRSYEPSGQEDALEVSECTGAVA
ncbi:hypothetical protein N0V88_007564 [Collariella sp. IMI 366227]|nr:hypothetical protein N0V88_007564 [Collariella sp. IMI 366227]